MLNRDCNLIPLPLNAEPLSANTHLQKDPGVKLCSVLVVCLVAVVEKCKKSESLKPAYILQTFDLSLTG